MLIGVKKRGIWVDKPRCSRAVNRKDDYATLNKMIKPHPVGRDIQPSPISDLSIAFRI